MSRKMKVVVSVLVAVLLLTVGGTVALADEEPTPQSGVNRLLARVAGILGIEQEELADAFNQARQEMHEEQQQWCEEHPKECQQSQEMRQQKWQEKWQERRGQVLGKAVEKERLTPEEAEEIEGWWESKPEALDNVKPRARIFKPMRGRHMIAVPNGWQGQIPYNPTD